MKERQLENEVFNQKRYNEVALQRIYKRDLPQLIEIKEKLAEHWGCNASFADAISFLKEFYVNNKQGD